MSRLERQVLSVVGRASSPVDTGYAYTSRVMSLTCQLSEPQGTGTEDGTKDSAPGPPWLPRDLRMQGRTQSSVSRMARLPVRHGILCCADV
jgi:hypothetical protein